MHRSRSRQYLRYDDEDDDNEDEYSFNSANFQAKTSRFCMEVDPYNMAIMMMVMIMMMIIAVTQSIFKLGSPDFAVYIILMI